MKRIYCEGVCILLFCVAANLSASASPFRDILADTCDQGNTIYLYSQADVDAFPSRYPCSRVCSILIIAYDPNDYVTNLDSLYRLTSIGSLEIHGNPRLKSLKGLSHITEVSGGCGGNLMIYHNDSLPSLDGLSALHRIEGTLTIEENNTLTNLRGLDSLTQIGGSLSIYYNQGLLNFDGLNKLMTITGSLSVSGNPVMTTMDALSSLSGATGGFGISDNPSLFNLHGLAGITSTNGPVGINNNDGLVNVDDLSNLTSIGTNATTNAGLSVSGNSSLLNIDGLHNLTFIPGILTIEANEALTNIDGLSSVTFVEARLGERQSAIYIRNNSSLENINGLSSLTRIGPGQYAGFFIENNPKLTNVDGLAGLLNVGGSFHGDCALRNNATLKNISGLSSLVKINGAVASMSVENNPALFQFCGLFPLLDAHGIGSSSCLPHSCGSLNITGNGQDTNWDEIVAAGRCSEGEPEDQPTILVFTQLTSTSVNLSFHQPAPSPNGYLVLMKAYGPPAPGEVPTDSAAYSIGDTVGSSSTVVMVGSDTTFQVAGLLANTPYYFDVFAFNNTTHGYDYLIVHPLEGGVTTPESFSTTSTSLSFLDVTSNSMTVSTDTVLGNYIAVMRAYASPSPDELPLDGQTYQVGTVIGANSIVVYNGADTTFNVSDLLSATPYYFDVYSYSTSHVYARPPLQGSQSTSSEDLTAGRSMQPFPNPFTESTTIPFSTDGEGQVQITIYDQTGRVVTDVLNDHYQAGYHVAVWRGVNGNGQRVGEGIYYYRVVMEKGRAMNGRLAMK